MTMRRVLTALCLAVLGLVLIGLITVGSASSVRGLSVYGDPLFFTIRQIVWCVVGAVGAIIAARTDYHVWRRPVFFWTLFAVLLVSLILVLIPGIGTSVNGSRRWIRLSVFSLQPSEFGKIGVVILFSAWMDAIGWKAKRFLKGFLYPCLLLVVVLALLLMEPDFGATAVTAALAGAILFAAGTRWIYLMGSGILGAAVIGVMVWQDPVRLGRIEAWLAGADSGSAASHQMKQSILAFVNGGVSGVGINNSMQKQFYLPEAHTDFIFAITGEEFGLMGTMGVVLLFVVLLVCGIWIAFKAPDRLGRLIAFGLTLSIVLQAALNMGVVIGALPTKGLARPLLSYGGTNMLATLTAIGILINIGRHAEEVEADSHAHRVRNAAKRI
jgi:cell division protein FtsW